MPANSLRIKGSKNGIVIEFEEDIGQAVTLLEDKLKNSPAFFSGSEAIIVLPETFIVEEQFLARLTQVLANSQVKLRELRRVNSTTIIETEIIKTPEKIGVEQGIFWVEKRLRSGDRITADGDLVIVGDVNPGAEVVATGNILVWGNLLGVAHAGSDGNEKSRIRALRLQATQLRIGSHISRAPDDLSTPQGPEVARVGPNGIVIEAWEKLVTEPLPFWRRLFIHGREVKL